MNDLVPNSPINRLRHIAKQYGRHPEVVFSMVGIIANAIGEDHWKTEVRHAAELVERDATGAPERAAAQEFVSHLQKLLSLSPGELLEQRYRLTVKDLTPPLVEMVSELPRFRGRSEADGAFPWMAKQLNTLAAESPRRLSFQAAVIALREKGPVIGRWLKKTRPNLMSMSYEEVIDAVDNFEEETAEVPQGEVVEELSDGWTAQKLTTEEQLDVEGRIMQHCVGSYCSAVEREETIIYSLRDAKGRPHVTIEFDPRRDRVTQIKGKQNARPDPDYQKYVDEFLDTIPGPTAVVREIAEVLQSKTDIEDEYEFEAAEEWEHLGFDAEAVGEWVDAGVWYNEANLADSLRDESVTPEEFGNFPVPVHRVLQEESMYIGDAVKLARVTRQVTEAKAARVPGVAHSQLDLLSHSHASREEANERRKKNSSTWAWIDFDHDPESPDWDVFLAEDWIETGFIEEDPDDIDDPWEDVSQWVLYGFTPEEASAWHDALSAESAWRADGRIAAEGMLAPRVIRDLVSRGITPEDVRDLGVKEGGDVYDVLDALERAGRRMSANRRRGRA